MASIQADVTPRGFLVDMSKDVKALTSRALSFFQESLTITNVVEVCLKREREREGEGQRERLASVEHK